MIGLPDLIGRLIDVEEPPYNHQGEGMQCVLWRVFEEDGFTWVESTEGYGWRIGPTTLITLIDSQFDQREMNWRYEMEEQQHGR